MAYPVTPADIEARWRPLSGAEYDVAATLLDDAMVKVNARRPTLQQAFDDGLVPIQVIKDVLVDMVQRVLRNPDVIRAQNISSDGSIGLTYGMGEDTVRANMRLQVTEDHLASLDAALRAAAALASRVGSQKLSAYASGVTMPLWPELMP